MPNSQYTYLKPHLAALDYKQPLKNDFFGGGGALNS